ncbi:ABC transporter permease subunit [Cohnella candidum]|uniref:ABC transporter permease subunit n=1 Tax=Cohnella candidum TaxID=2674991 RepID=A0A3G3JYM9_9BACL|nr:ABC transporter permease subunit [Cohnella candidum]AYQ72951.1 ABC transporter permease subunit [Cohnella candidum]
MRQRNRGTILYYLSWVLIVLVVLTALLGSWIKPHGLSDPDKIHLHQEMVDGKMKYKSPPFEPNADFMLGTDHRGYDVFSLLLNGMKYTLGYALLLTLFRFLIALPWGVWTGTTGKGGGLLRYMQWVISAVPAFLFLYPPLAGMYYGLGLDAAAKADPSYKMLFTVTFYVMVTFVGVFPLAYQLRERARFYHDKLYVDVSRLMGGSLRHRIVRHVLPNMRLELLFLFLSEFVQVLFLMGQLAVFKIMIGGAETLEVDLGEYMEITATGEWNSLLAYGIEYIRQYPWIILSASTSLFLLILSVQFFLAQLKRRFGGV